MKIENRAYDNHKTFDELKCGDVFIHDSEVCMKTDGDDGESNAVSLESGYEMRFYQDDEVRLVSAILTVE